MGRPRGTFAVFAVLVTVIGLTGCESPQAVAPTATSAPVESAAPTPTTTPPAAPHLVQGGTAEDNHAYFDVVNKALFTDQPQATGRTIIDSLVAAGFDKSAMQVTPDTTPTGKNTDSIQFSVQLGADCLIGQSGSGEYTSVVGPALATGGCLVGKTRPIDW
ncbi:hypothetical protein GCM10027052_11650 [Parafrigoribacterium mesophilum]|uniref:DUF6993 domain-containing protein n=1 Tax=Parafrigoribacterium mesophilum TaxID=433646 RepID=UPI0031FBDB6F